MHDILSVSSISLQEYSSLLYRALSCWSQGTAHTKDGTLQEQNP